MRSLVRRIGMGLFLTIGFPFFTYYSLMTSRDFRSGFAVSLILMTLGLLLSLAFRAEGVMLLAGPYLMPHIMLVLLGKWLNFVTGAFNFDSLDL